MSIKNFIFLFLCLSLNSSAKEEFSETSSWKVFFNKHHAVGTVAVVDDRKSSRKLSVYNGKRAAQRYSPASTFKIPHTLFALDAGLIEDQFQVFPWDGVERNFDLHNKDQNVRSAVRNSVLWVYEEFAKEIGAERAQKYLEKIDYGNMDSSVESGVYWIHGGLAISAFEQIAFLQKLYRNELPFRIENQLLVKDILIREAGKDWILRAKTGWAGRYGWWVGWVEWPSGPVFFALNIDTPNGLKDLYKREAIVRDILLSLDALPSQASM
ncbi:class D beta-lactamase [Porticoccus sp. W117]|uniref:class D beta-lactamase n=1 Tax=Porticoccus sp. W117 TaxID=3054777 RepID=UPI00259A751B|nr:class D beta-lactamase [Porticoccus sp. W117]MDM3871450.1 class D beta-lactamase [Porticoccus sp. W117]